MSTTCLWTKLSSPAAMKISIRDTAVRKNRKENFYHGILLGLLGHREDWIVTSNAESGDGYSGILVELAEEGIGIVIEVKYAEEGLLEAACTEALAQIAGMDYDGIGCCRKKCKVVVQG